MRTLRALHVQDGQVFGTVGTLTDHRTLVRFGQDDVGMGGEPWIGAPDPSGRYMGLVDRHGTRLIDQDRGAFVDLPWPTEPTPPRQLLPRSDGRSAVLVLEDGVWLQTREASVQWLAGARAAAATSGFLIWSAAGDTLQLRRADDVIWSGEWLGHALAASPDAAVVAGDRTHLLSPSGETLAEVDAGPARVATWYDGAILAALDGRITLTTPTSTLHTSVEAEVTGLAADASCVYVGTADGRFLALSRSDLSLCWGWTVPDEGRPEPLRP